jgi:thymidine kinase
MGSDSDCDYEFKINTYGRLELIIGNMFSGKSTELIRRINREKSIHKKILVINFIDDNRYSTNEVSTHDQTKIECLKLKKLSDLDKNIIKTYDSFFIDEGQFFIDLYQCVIQLVENYKKHFVVSGLDGDANRNIFGDVIKLIPICDTVDKLHAYCNKCNNGRIAPFTKKINSSDSSVIDIGGTDKYIPVCRYHYNIK